MLQEEKDLQARTAEQVGVPRRVKSCRYS